MNNTLLALTISAFACASVGLALDTPALVRDSDGKGTARPVPSAGPSFPDRNPRYKIGRGDVIEITFPRVPEFTQTVTVQPDGYVTLKGVEEGNDLYVVNKSVPEMVAMLRTTYAKILHDPVITVEMKDFEKPYFTTFGEISKPGKYDLRGETTVVQALSLCGGFRDSAKTSEVLLLRRVSDQWTEVKKLDVKRMLKTGDLKEDMHMQPGDILYIPKSFLGKIDRFIPNSSVGAMVKPY